MKKIVTIFIIGFCFLTFGSGVWANTVTINFEGVMDEISGFDLFYLEPDSEYGWPVETVVGAGPPNFGNDHTWVFGADQPYSGQYWGIDTFIDNVDNATDDGDYVRGISAYDSYFDASWNKLNNGVVLTLTSMNTNFGIDLMNPGNRFFDYQGSLGEIIPMDTFNVTETWVNGDQIVTFSQIPIPGAVWLLGSGLVGLVGIRRRFVS